MGYVHWSLKKEKGQSGWAKQSDRPDEYKCLFATQSELPCGSDF